MIRTILLAVARTCVEIAILLTFLACVGAVSGCGGSTQDEPDDDKKTIDPVLCLPSDAGTRGCAK